MSTMRWVVDAIYLLTAVLTAPIWIVRLVSTGKIRTDWAARFGRLPISILQREPRHPTVLIHTVSVGEVNLIRGFVEKLAEADIAPRIVIAVTTDTGMARAHALYGDQFEVIRHPFDLSWALRRVYRAINPSLLVLVELEIWPNESALCRDLGIPICVVNGRLSERSFRRYQRIRAVVSPMFQRLNLVLAQTNAYADRFRALGVANDRVRVCDTMKWDTASLTVDSDTAEALAAAMGLDRTRPIVVAGATAPGEHALLHRAVPEDVQLVCAPRKPEWFDEAAREMPGCVRRSAGERGRVGERNRFLLDTIGELRHAYSLADIAVVGRTFEPFHGSDMMEPIALGCPTIVGPSTENFQEVVEALLEGDGLVQTTGEELPDVVRNLLNDPQRRDELVRNGQRVIRNRQGATAQQAEAVLTLLRSSSPTTH